MLLVAEERQRRQLRGRHLCITQTSCLLHLQVEHQSSLSSRGEDVGTECRAEQPAGVATAAAMSSSSGEVKQHFTDRRWDEALDLMLRRLCYGTLAGGVAGFLLLSECWQLLGRGCGAAGRHCVRCWGGVAADGEALPMATPVLLIALIFSCHKTSCLPHRAAGAPTARATALGVGAGFGLGSAYQKNQDLFHEIFGVQPDASKKGST